MIRRFLLLDFDGVLHPADAQLISPLRTSSCLCRSVRPQGFSFI